MDIGDNYCEKDENGKLINLAFTIVNLKKVVAKSVKSVNATITPPIEIQLDITPAPEALPYVSYLILTAICGPYGANNS